jgi:predicted kinase
MHDRVYATLFDSARSVLASRYSAIVDAVFGQPNHRAEIARIAMEANVPFCALWLEAPLATLENRITARQGDASDATTRIVRKQIVEIAKPFEWHAIDAGGTPGHTLAAAEAVLVPKS